MHCRVSSKAMSIIQTLRHGAGALESPEESPEDQRTATGHPASVDTIDAQVSYCIALKQQYEKVGA